MKNNIKKAEASKEELEQSGRFSKPIATKILPDSYILSELKNITKDTIRKTHSAMSYIVKAQDEMLLLSNIGQRIMLI
ncbi:hypothetical protein ACT7DG_20130 [Bacillus cereus]